MASSSLANELALTSRKRSKFEGSRDSTCVYSEVIMANEVVFCCYLARVLRGFAAASRRVRSGR